MGAALGWVTARRTAAAGWPPTAEREATELSARAVLGIFAAALALELLIFVRVADSAVRPLSPFSPATDAVVRHLVVPGAISLWISIGLVLMLGWSRAAGLRVGTPSRWATFPLLALWVGGALTMGRSAVAMPAGATWWVILFGLVLAAAAEEILFRGFLLHGLTRSMGGRRAVLASSAIFAAAHVPSLIASSREGGSGGVDTLTLLVLFGLAVFLCRVRAETGSIWLPSGIHALWNFVTIGILGTGEFDALSLAIVAMKLVPVVIGVVLAVQLARRRISGSRPIPPRPIGTALPPPPPPPRPDS